MEEAVRLLGVNLPSSLNLIWSSYNFTCLYYVLLCLHSFTLFAWWLDFILWPWHKACFHKSCFPPLHSLHLWSSLFKFQRSWIILFPKLYWKHFRYFHYWPLLRISSTNFFPKLWSFLIYLFTFLTFTFLAHLFLPFLTHLHFPTPFSVHPGHFSFHTSRRPTCRPKVSQGCRRDVLNPSLNAVAAAGDDDTWPSLVWPLCLGRRDALQQSPPFAAWMPRYSRHLEKQRLCSYPWRSTEDTKEAGTWIEILKLHFRYVCIYLSLVCLSGGGGGLELWCKGHDGNKIALDAGRNEDKTREIDANKGM